VRPGGEQLRGADYPDAWLGQQPRREPVDQGVELVVELADCRYLQATVGRDHLHPGPGRRAGRHGGGDTLWRRSGRKLHGAAWHHDGGALVSVAWMRMDATPSLTASLDVLDCIQVDRMGLTTPGRRVQAATPITGWRHRSSGIAGAGHRGRTDEGQDQAAMRSTTKGGVTPVRPVALLTKAKVSKWTVQAVM
jgi:hypothetical protein